MTTPSTSVKLSANETPIIFSASMVRAILGRRKTQTRRIVKPQPEQHELIYWREDDEYPSWVVGSALSVGEGYVASSGRFIKCPYGKPGDKIWVKETHWRLGVWVKDRLTKTGRERWRFKATRGNFVRFVPDERIPKRTEHGWHKRPSIFMPRWAARIILELTDVRVERLIEISEADAQAEGMVGLHGYGFKTLIPDGRRAMVFGSRGEFAEVWESLHGAGSWTLNPWVWVLTFKAEGE